MEPSEDQHSPFVPSLKDSVSRKPTPEDIIRLRKYRKSHEALKAFMKEKYGDF